MVKKGDILDNFDNIVYIDAPCPTVLVGAGNGIGYIEKELYDKGLVLLAKWDKLPVLERIRINPELSRIAGANIQVTGQTVLIAEIKMYNSEYDDIDPDNLIAVGSCIILTSAGVITDVIWQWNDIDMNQPLRNTICVVMESKLPANAAGTALLAGTIDFNVFLDIDYIQYSPEKLKDWMLKEVFLDNA